MLISKSAATHRILSAEITRIALCKRGKNGFRTIVKEDGSLCWESLTKATGENELLAVVYAPERPDEDGHVADAAVIKAACHEYNRDHRELDIEHDGKKLSDKDAFVAESFIVAKGDERFRDWKGYDGQPVGDLTGAWASVIKLENPALQKACRDGELDGVSMFGRAALERVDTRAASKRVAERLGKAHDHHQEIDMDETKLKEILSGFKAEIATMVKSAVADIVKPVEPTKEEPKPEILKAPAFKGSATNPKDLETFEAELRTYEFQKALADGNLSADKVAEMRKAAAIGEPSDKDAGIEAEDTPLEKDLKRQLHKARRTRNAPEGGATQSEEAILAKANADEGLAIAKLVNERRGVADSMRVVKS